MKKAASNRLTFFDTHDTVVPGKEMANINLRDIDDNLRDDFKALCAKRRSDMKTEIVKYMTREVERAEKRKVAKK